MLTLALNIIIATLVLWVLFINTMAIRNILFEKFPDGLTGLFVRLFGFPIGTFAYIFDVIYNYTYATLLWWQWNPKGATGPTLSERLRWNHKHLNRSTWRWKLGHWFCVNLIEPWDDDHCKMDD